MEKLRELVLWGWEGYHRCGVTQSAAAMAYFLLLTLFPLLLCVHALAGIFRLELEPLLAALEQVIPRAAMELLGTFLDQADRAGAGGAFLAALGAIALPATAGVRTILHAMDRLYGRRTGRGVGRLALSGLLSGLMFLSICLSVVVILTGEWFFAMLEGFLPSTLPLEGLRGLWLGLRFLVLYCAMLLLVLTLYRAGSPQEERGGWLTLSAMGAAGGLVACSAVFSWFVEVSSRYSLVYGSLASIIILMVWLYLCGNILLLGAVVGRAACQVWGKGLE